MDNQKKDGELGFPELTNWKEPRMHGTGRCYWGKTYWYEHTLWEAAKLDELKPFDLPLACIDMDYLPWHIKDVEDFAYHMMKIQEADLRYPITLHSKGGIIDGWHRIVKTLIDGVQTIKAVRFENMPQEDGKDE